MAHPSLEHAAEVWWMRGKVTKPKLVASQEKVGRKLLWASRIVAGATIRGDGLGCKKLEERREEKRYILYGRRLRRLKDGI